MQAVGSQKRPRVAAVQRSATVAWGPTSAHSNLMAAGTVAGAISDSFDATAHLEIFSLDLGSRSGDMPLLGSVQTSDRFHRLAWGSYGHESGTFSHGILAGGMVDGSIKIFNPAAMISCVPTTQHSFPYQAQFRDSVVQPFQSPYSNALAQSRPPES